MSHKDGDPEGVAQRPSAALIPRNSRKAADPLKCESLRYLAAARDGDVGFQSIILTRPSTETRAGRR